MDMFKKIAKRECVFPREFLPDEVEYIDGLLQVRTQRANVPSTMTTIPIPLPLARISPIPRPGAGRRDASVWCDARLGG